MNTLSSSSAGTIIQIVDHGSLVQVTVNDDQYGPRNVVGNGNMTRTALHDSGLGVGDRIVYEVADWGGLLWFAPEAEVDLDDDV